MRLRSRSLPKADGRLTPTVRRALQIYARLEVNDPGSTADVLAMSAAVLKARRRLIGLLHVELETMTRRELANYYAGVTELRRTETADGSRRAR
jgi:hypothetical protein